MKELTKVAASTDPAQETLRKRKKDFNKELSLLIAQIIAFKRGINGRGEPRVGIPPSDIKYPLPREVGQYLEQMVDRFEKVVEDSKEVMREQENYAKTRRKGHKEMEQSGDLSPAISSNEVDIIKEATWWGSRLWAYLKYTPQLWNKQLKLRMRMLWVSADVSRGLLDLENYLVSADENAVPRAFYSLVKLRNRIASDMGSTLLDILTILKGVAEQPKEDLPPQEESTKPEPSELPVPLSGKSEPSSWEPNVDWDRIDFVQKEITTLENVNLLLISRNLITEDQSKTLVKTIGALKKIADKEIGLSRLSNKYMESPEASARFGEMVRILFAKYEETLSAVNNIFANTGASFNSFEEMVPALSKQAFDSNEIINKLAHNWLSRMVKRWRLNVFPSYTDKIRLKCVQKVAVLHQEFGDLQDLLEKKDNDIFLVASRLMVILDLFAGLAGEMLSLAVSHNNMYEEVRLDENKVSMRPISAQHMAIMKKSETDFANLSAKIKSEIEGLQSTLGTTKGKDEQ
jgi:hypothetical protein